MDDYKINDWGVANFEFHKKGKTVRITAFGQVLDIEPKVILFRDDYQEYIISKKKFSFEKKPDPVQK